MYIHRAGFRVLAFFLLILGSIAFGLHWFSGWPNWVVWPLSGVLGCFYLLLLWFFRVPHRPFDAQSNEVTAVSDGKVVLVEEVDELEAIGGKAIKVCVFLSIFDVHAQWAPIGGVLETFRYHPGQYLVAWHPKSSTLNERTTYVQRTPAGLVVWRQIAGAVARRIRWYVEEGEQVQHGQECGFILFGSRIDLYLPLDARVLVKPGDRVVARSTVVARLPEVH